VPAAAALSIELMLTCLRRQGALQKRESWSSVEEAYERQMAGKQQQQQRTNECENKCDCLKTNAAERLSQTHPTQLSLYSLRLHAGCSLRYATPQLTSPAQSVIVARETVVKYSKNP